jgi:hypothetical protein
MRVVENKTTYFNRQISSQLRYLDNKLLTNVRPLPLASRKTLKIPGFSFSQDAEDTGTFSRLVNAER